MHQAKFEARNPKSREIVRRKVQVVLPLIPNALLLAKQNSELTPKYPGVSLDELFSELILTGARIQSGPSKKALFWGERVSGIASYLAGWMAERGIDVIVLDGANGFDPYRVSSFARKALVPPERLLKKIRIARAFTCFQMATLVERLTFLLHQEGESRPKSLSFPFRKPSIILLGPITTFLDEDVPEREINSLFERSLRKMEIMAGEEVPLFLLQSFANAPFNKGGHRYPKPDDGTGWVVGLKGSKRAHLMKRLFQFSNLVWKILLGKEGPRLLLEKGPTENVGNKDWVRGRSEDSLF